MASRRRVLQRGPRVHVHAPVAGEWEELAALVRRSRKLHHPWMHPRAEDRATYRAYLARLRSGGHAGFVLRRHEDGAALGLVNVNEIVRGAFHSGYLGYWIGAPFARAGYMTEGLGLVLRHVFGPLKLHRVEANIQPDNEPSKALVRRLGFRCEGYSPRYLKIGGCWRDHERWALLAEEWRAGRARR